MSSVRAKIMKGQGAKRHLEGIQRVKSMRVPEAYFSHLKGHFKMDYLAIFSTYKIYFILSFMQRSLEI